MSLSFPPSTKIFLSLALCDMRKDFDGLAAQLYRSASKPEPRPFRPQVIGTKQLSQIDWGSARRRSRPPLPLLTPLLSILA